MKNLRVFHKVKTIQKIIDIIHPSFGFTSWRVWNLPHGKIEPLASRLSQTFARVKLLEPSELSAEARRYRDGETHQAAPGGRRGKTTSRRVKFLLLEWG